MQSNNTTLFLVHIAALAERYHPNDVVSVLHATLKLHYEMNAVGSMIATLDRVRRNKLAGEALCNSFARKRLNDFRAQYGEIAIELCLAVYEHHGTLKNEVDALLARLTISRKEADSLLGLDFPIQGYKWNRYGGLQL